MAMTQDNFGQLLTPIHKKITVNSYNEKAPQYPSIYRIEIGTQKTVSYPHLGSLGEWQENTEGAVINESDMSQGYTASVEPIRYDNGYSITWELVKDDQYNVMRGLGKGGSAKGLGKGIRVVLEKLAANLINNGFATACYDGQYLFDTDHPSADSDTTGSNLISGALTDANMKTALTNFSQQIDEAGMYIQSMADIWFIARNLDFTAQTIQQSSMTAGELSNNTNTVPRMRLQVLDYLTDGYWGLKDSSIDNLIFTWWDKPMFDSMQISKTIDWFMYGYTRANVVAMDWRGIAASPGS